MWSHVGVFTSGTGESDVLSVQQSRFIMVCSFHSVHFKSSVSPAFGSSTTGNYDCYTSQQSSGYLQLHLVGWYLPWSWSMQKVRINLGGYVSRDFRKLERQDLDWGLSKSGECPHAYSKLIAIRYSFYWPMAYTRSFTTCIFILWEITPDRGLLGQQMHMKPTTCG